MCTSRWHFFEVPVTDERIIALTGVTEGEEYLEEVVPCGESTCARS
jgi:hypothetical protein